MGNSRDKLVDDVTRLRDLDAALRSEGVNVPTQAEEWQTTTRTVHRYLESLRQLVGPTEVIRLEDQTFRQRYAGKAPKLFAKGT